MLLGLAVGILVRVWQNTRRKSADVERRNLSPSEMSAAERARELGDNLAAGKEYAGGEGVSPQLRAEIEAAVAELEAKRQSQRLEIVAFGTISSGKSSLLERAGRPRRVSHQRRRRHDRHAERNPLAGAATAIVLVDTPGLAEVRGESRAAESAAAAKNADLVLFVVDGPLKAYEHDLLAALAKMEKRIVVCLNKEDWYDDTQRDELLGQIVEQVAPMVKAADVVAVRSRPVSRRRVHVLADGSEEEETVDRTGRHQPARPADDVDRRARRPRAAAGQPAAAIPRPGRRSRSSGCSRPSTSGPTK